MQEARAFTRKLIAIRGEHHSADDTISVIRDMASKGDKHSDKWMLLPMAANNIT